MIINVKQQMDKKIEKGFFRLSLEDNKDLNLKYTSDDNMEQIQFVLNKREIKQLKELLNCFSS